MKANGIYTKAVDVFMRGVWGFCWLIMSFSFLGILGSVLGDLSPAEQLTDATNCLALVVALFCACFAFDRLLRGK